MMQVFPGLEKEMDFKAIKILEAIFFFFLLVNRTLETEHYYFC